MKALVVTAQATTTGEIEMAVFTGGEPERFKLSRVAAAGAVREIAQALAIDPKNVVDSLSLSERTNDIQI